ncbi:MAG TPA: hypothetical protein VE034_05785 [Burkholderiales bacterium]|nr:hypothetical protein [Burkholderiales bacterium]
MTLRGFLGLAALLIAGPVFAQSSSAVNPLATRPGWEIGAQLAQYEYREPDFAKVSGNRLGFDGAGTLTSGPLFGRFEARVSYGSLDYKGSGTSTAVPDWTLEARLLAGVEWLGSSASFSPYLGLGYRYLFDDLRGYSSTGAAGYRRYSNYIYAPVGFTLRFLLGDGWVLAPTLEADIFLRGKQISNLSDTGIPGYQDVTNMQTSGRGHRAALMFEKDNFAFGLWTHYWHIDDSDVQFAGVVAGRARFGGEPENYTRESGIELRYRF